jgi:oligopeptide transport system ATP-binding protein
VTTHPLLDVRGLGVTFDVSSGLFRRALPLQALSEVDFALNAGETLGIVGESGSGKSTLARAVLQLTRPTTGEVIWRGRRLSALDAAQLRAARRELQPVFQDPRSSLDPRMTIDEVVAEPLSVNGAAREGEDALVAQALERVGLSLSLRHRYPHELSGGQCQRVAIARALVSSPALLVCDEPVSALDVSVQAQIINLLRTLRDQLGLAMLFVSHNLAVVRYVSSRVMVLYLGRVMETAPLGDLYARPLHPYTRALLAAIPDPFKPTTGVRTAVTRPEPPSAFQRPSGCEFRTRCPFAIGLCAEQRPPLQEVEQGRWVACHRWREVAASPLAQNG